MVTSEIRSPSGLLVKFVLSKYKLKLCKAPLEYDKNKQKNKVAPIESFLVLIRTHQRYDLPDLKMLLCLL